MVISDLQHFEVVEEISTVVGGTDYHDYIDKYKLVEFKLPAIAIADGEADALAVGQITATNTSTDTQAVAGIFSKSSSKSSALAVGKSH